MKPGENAVSYRRKTMAFEDFLRSVPLVHKHIMRTRRMMHENRQFRKFLERNGIQPDAVIANESEVDGDDLVSDASTIPNSDLDAAFKTMAISLRNEQKRSSHLEASLYVLQIDYNKLLLQSNETDSLESASTGKTKNAKKLRDKNDP